MYKDINDVIKELENIKGFLLEFSRNDPLKTILFTDLAALNNAILIISENHKGHTIEEIRKRLEEEEQLEKLEKEIFKGGYKMTEDDKSELLSYINSTANMIDYLHKVIHIYINIAAAEGLEVIWEGHKAIKLEKKKM